MAQKIENTIEACCPLVAARKQPWSSTTMFVTVSPNPRMKHKVLWTSKRLDKKCDRKMEYGKMPQRVQYEYCMRLLNTYTFHCPNSTIVGTVELNTTGNVHLHMLIDDPDCFNVTRLQMLQREISLSEETSKNIIKCKRDYMNNICFINKPIMEIAKYMDKDHHMNGEIFKNYVYNYEKKKDDMN